MPQEAFDQQRGGHSSDFTLRDPQPGDLGWIISRHGSLYAREQGFDWRFEALVARIIADFVDHFDPTRERCWIAEASGAPIGSVCITKSSDPATAKLRLLLIDPAARGMGLGKRLVAVCIAFSRAAGYHRITLGTQAHLDAARSIYAAAGFQIVQQQPEHCAGRDVIAETWELEL